MKTRRIIGSLALILALLAGTLTFPITSQAAAFNSNNLIDDMTFNNVNTMNAAQIDAFLNARGSCLSSNSGFGAIDPIGYNVNQGYLYGGVVTAGTVIAHAAQAYDINPQVLLTTLQKEQSLITSTACTTNTISKAMGYACPDSGGSYSYTGLNLYMRGGITYTDVSGICVNKATKAGFTQQIIRAAWLLKFSQQRSLGNINWAIVRGNWDNSDDLNSCYGGAMTTGYRKRCPNDTATYYDGYTTIDGVATHMDTGATAALYRYTPHFHGNQNFDTIFNQYFGSQYANDSFEHHPNGTLISLGGRIYLVKNDSLSYISNASVFLSYGYSWSAVKAATTGDAGLPLGPLITDFAPGTLFRSDNTPTYVMNYEGGVLKKQQLSLSAFNNLGYKWGQVMYVPPNEVPADTAATILFDNQHPAGSLVVDAAQGRIYAMDKTTRKYISNPLAFTSNNFRWENLKQATAADLSIPIDPAPIDVAQGAILLGDNGIYLIDYDASGILFRPVGPWECYTNRMHFTSSDWVRVPNSSLPGRLGSLFTC